MRRLLALTLLAALAACGSVMTDRDDSDPAIKARVEGVLRGRTDLETRYVTVSVDQRVVVLSGLVPTQTQRRLAGSLTHRVPGVDQVLNNLVVQD
jgi:osmotically-inducible protein OsmY